MLNGIGVFDLTSARLSYETAGLRVVADNIANADTPGFHGRAVVPFEETLRHAGGLPPLVPGATRRAYADGGATVVIPTGAAAVDEEAPNRNTVSLEDEMMQAARLRAGHALAATTFEKNLELMRLAVGSS